MKSNYKLGEDQLIPCWISFFTHMKWIPLMIKCTFLLWLTCFIFWSLLAWEYQFVNTTWNIMTSSLLGVACFSWSTLLISSTKHLKCSSDHHFHVSLPSTTLGLPTHRRQAPTLGRSDLSPRTILDTHLIDWSKWWT